MEAPAEHYASHDTTYTNRYEAFSKGVAVFEFTPATTLDASSHPHEPETGSPTPTRIEAGQFYTSAKDVLTCKRCKEAGHVVRDCPQAIQCRGCSEYGHMNSSCPNRTCHVCGRQGHLASACSERTCNACGAKGHLASTCPTARRCHICNGQGHEKKDCPARDNCRNCRQPGHKLVDCMEPGPSKVQQPQAPPKHEPKSTPIEEPGPSKSEAPPKEQAESSSTEQAESSSTKQAEPSPTEKAESPPVGTFDPPLPGQLDARFITQFVERHITSLNLEFLASYPDPRALGGSTTKKAIIRFAPTNFTSQMTVEQLAKDSEGRYAETDVRQLSAEAVGNLYELVGMDGAVAQLYRFTFSFRALFDSQGTPTNLLGLGIFTDSEYGPHTHKIHAIRDALRQDTPVTISFFTLAAPWVESRLASVLASMDTQRRHSPVYDWCRQRRVNLQLGQQLEKEERPVVKIPARYQFDFPDELFVVHYYGAIYELEAIPSSAYVDTVVRLVEFADSNQRAYLALIEMAEHLPLRVDARFKLQFLGENADEDAAWNGLVVPPLPYANGLELTTFLRRPHSTEEGWVEHPVLADAHIIHSGGPDRDTRALQAALRAHPGIRARVRVEHPKSSHQREVNTVREISHNQDRYETETRALLNNDLLSLPLHNYFEKLVAYYGRYTVLQAIDLVCQTLGLKDNQLRFFTMLEELRAGIAVVQGSGGTGKSLLIEALVLLHYVLGVEHDDPERERGFSNQLWIVSPLNRQLNDLAGRVYETLCNRYHQLQDHGQEVGHPIVIRRHMRETETGVWKKPAMDQRKALGIGRDAEYIPFSSDDPEIVESDMLRLSVELNIRRAYLQSQEGWGDKRLKKVDLSEGQWMLHLAGEPIDKDGNLHPIADPDPDRFSHFRQLLEDFARGNVTTAEEKTELTLAANQVVSALAKMADVILMTPHVLSEHRSYSISTPYAVLHDEAGKTTERAALGAFVWSKQSLAAATILFHILFGDFTQPRPVLRPGQDAPFHEQVTVPLFLRFLLGGATQLWLTLQHRYVRDIADLVNDILPGEQVRTDASVENLPRLDLARKFFHAMGFSRTCGFFDTNNSKALVNDVSKSTFNLAHADRGLYLALWALRFGFDGEDIGIAVPYVAQLNVYISGRYELMRWCKQQAESGASEYVGVAEKIANVEIFTIDGIQGAQLNIVILDTTVAGPLGFMADTSRIHLGVSRARVGLVLIGNHKACAQAATKEAYYRKTAYYKVVHHCQQRGCLVNLDNKKDAAQLSKITMPTEFDATLAGVHGPRPDDMEPFDLGEDTPYTGCPPDLVGHSGTSRNQIGQGGSKNGEGSSKHGAVGGNGEGSGKGWGADYGYSGDRSTEQWLKTDAWITYGDEGKGKAKAMEW